MIERSAGLAYSDTTETYIWNNSTTMTLLSWLSSDIIIVSDVNVKIVTLTLISDKTGSTNINLKTPMIAVIYPYLIHNDYERYSITLSTVHDSPVPLNSVMMQSE